MLLVLLGFFSLPSQELGWEERLRNDLFCRVGRKTLLHSTALMLLLVVLLWDTQTNTRLMLYAFRQLADGASVTNDE